MDTRTSGILLHIPSLPSEYGIGDLGPHAYRFVDFLHAAKQGVWQILPLNPTDSGCQNSPYSSYSAFAGNTLLISPQLLLEEGFLRKGDISLPPAFPMERIDYEAAIAYKSKLFEKAYGHFKRRRIDRDAFVQFRERSGSWLPDYALFIVLKELFQGAVWTSWPEGLKKRERGALQKARKEFNDPIEKKEFLQFIFYRQWVRLKAYCHQKGVRVFGDIPIYVSFDSTDLWQDPEDFKLDAEYHPVAVAGVPPDYFSATGQRWGNPVYDWGRLKASRYRWWVQRIRHNLELFDFMRIDHFRGFVQCWEIPAEEPTAVKGRWMDVPALDFFDTVKKHFPSMPLIAEDLGVITDDVRAVMRAYGLAGMKVLLFAFNEDLQKHPYLPHNYGTNCVVYTGTHDNNTIQGWFHNEATAQEKENFFAYIGKDVPAKDIHWALIGLAMASKASLAIFPLQDVLGLGEEARFNKPAGLSGNWQWRLAPCLPDDAVTERLRHLTETSRRGVE
jgi:4-alpha-glucanotransferase